MRGGGGVGGGGRGEWGGGTAKDGDRWSEGRRPRSRREAIIRSPRG